MQFWLHKWSWLYEWFRLQVAEEAIAEARHICMRQYGDAPNVKVGRHANPCGRDTVLHGRHAVPRSTMQRGISLNIEGALWAQVYVARINSNLPYFQVYGDKSFTFP